VGLKSDGTVATTGANSSGQCNVANWTDISLVVAGYYHTVGLKTDGTVVAVGAGWGQYEVGGWTGGASPRSPQATRTWWGSSLTALWSPWDLTVLGSARWAAGRTSSRSPRGVRNSP
jgi:hypothetical protein